MTVVGSHVPLADTLAAMSGIVINGQELMPDVREQRQRELGVAVAMTRRLLDRQEWQLAVAPTQQPTRENAVLNLANLLTLRGHEPAFLARPAEARVCYQQALEVNPNQPEARERLQQLR